MNNRDRFIKSGSFLARFALFSCLTIGPVLAETGTPTVSPTIKPTEKRVSTLTVTPKPTENEIKNEINETNESELKPSTTPMQDDHGSRSNKVPKNLVPKCEKVTKRVDTIVTKFETNHDLYTNKNKMLLEKIEALVTKAKANNLDTTKLEADVLALKTAISNLTVLRSNNVAALNKTLDIQCGIDKGVFKSTFEEAKAKQKDNIEQFKKINELWKKVKEDLKLLRAQLHPETTTVPTTSVTTTVTVTEVPTATSMP